MAVVNMDEVINEQRCSYYAENHLQYYQLAWLKVWEKKHHETTYLTELQGRL